MKISDVLLESSGVDLEGKRLWHGTSKEENGLSILRDGYILGSTKSGRGHFTPITGRVYLSFDLHYSMIYSIGGSMFGSKINDKWIKDDGRYGYIFEVNGSELSDIQPDEDSVGKFLWKFYGEKNPSHEDRYLADVISRRMTPNQLKKIKMGEYSYYASGGKRALKKMSPWEKAALINRHGSHISVPGPVKWKTAYRVDKLRVPEMKRENLPNFLELVATQF